MLNFVNPSDTREYKLREIPGIWVAEINREKFSSELDNWQRHLMAKQLHDQVCKDLESLQFTVVRSFRPKLILFAHPSQGNLTIALLASESLSNPAVRVTPYYPNTRYMLEKKVRDQVDWGIGEILRKFAD